MKGMDYWWNDMGREMCFSATCDENCVTDKTSLNKQMNNVWNKIIAISLSRLTLRRLISYI